MSRLRLSLPLGLALVRLGLFLPGIALSTTTASRDVTFLVVVELLIAVVQSSSRNLGR